MPINIINQINKQILILNSPFNPLILFYLIHQINILSNLSSITSIVNLVIINILINNYLSKTLINNKKDLVLNFPTQV
jgi:hypothetical protein